MSEAEFDFEAALEAKFAALEQGTPAEEAEDSAEEPIPADVGIEEEAEETVEEQPRDDKGRFLPKFNDPDVQSFVSKHGGDLEKALKSAAHQESLVGRLGNEVGELRRMVEQRQQPVRPVGNAPDPEENPQQAAIWALETNDQGLYDRAMESWYDYSPREASRFERALEIQALEQKLSQSFAPVVQSTQQQTQAQQLAQAQRDLTAKYEDFTQVVGTATEDELQGFPRDTLRLIQVGDQAARTAALEAVYRWVKAGRPAGTPEPPKQPKQTKADAAVVTASSQPAREGKSGVEEFKKFLLAPDPTSTAAGRTYE